MNLLRRMYSVLKIKIELLQNLSYLIELYSVLPIGVTVYDPKTRCFTYVNRYVKKETGYTNEELLAYPVHKFVIDFERTDQEVEAISTELILKSMHKPRFFSNKWKAKSGITLEINWISLSVRDKIVSLVTIIPLSNDN